MGLILFIRRNSLSGEVARIFLPAPGRGDLICA
jgi:hypothetical protein